MLPSQRPQETDLRTRLIDKAQTGRWHKDTAERVAKRLNVGPLAGRPDPSRFDPMTEPVWTLAMVIAWIVWRTPDDVRENWDAYRFECWGWQHRPHLIPPPLGSEEYQRDEWRQTGESSWGFVTLGPASFADLRMDEALSECTDKEEARKLMTVRHAWGELRRRAVAGEFTVTAIQRGDSRPVQIPAHDWAYLEHISSWPLGNDGLDFDSSPDSHNPQYRDMTFRRDDVCRLWPHGSSGQATTQSKPRRRASMQNIRSRVAGLLKSNPTATVRDADKLAKQIDGNRDSVREEFNAARRRKGIPVKPGRRRIKTIATTES
jgi:hypothetical protein